MNPKKLLGLIFFCLFCGPAFSQDFCNINNIKNPEQAIAAQECVKKIIGEMKTLLGANEEVIKRHLSFVQASAKSSSDCLIIERNFLNKRNGLAYNASISEEQLRFCNRTTREIAVALTETARIFDEIKKRAKMTEDDIQAFELKYNQLSTWIAQSSVSK